MKKTEKSADGTSFRNVTIITTINELVKVLDEPTYQQNTGDDKVNVEWVCENEFGAVVTIYDWKEYRPLDDDETIEFHLGGHSEFSTLMGLEELIIALKK
jgi:extradiol dioxygenase family protein